MNVRAKKGDRYAMAVTIYGCENEQIQLLDFSESQ